MEGRSAKEAEFLFAIPETAQTLELTVDTGEVPRNSNRGPRVDEYLYRAGAPPGLPWFCAFVYCCFDETAKHLEMPNPVVRTAGSLGR